LILVPKLLLNLDGGEHADEAEELYVLADVVHVACGGHAGDERSMRRVIHACVAADTAVGAHPSYVDREGFGRRALVVASETLADQIAAQCALLRSVAESQGARVTSAKPHGALYHVAHTDEVTARACVDGIGRALGHVSIVGLAGGALERAAERGGHPYLREAFADRGTRTDGTLIPRGEPGAVLTEPRAAADTARALAKSGSVETLCIHADTPSALAIARAVRAALDEPPAEP
jgi:UPF0271 protein